MLYKELSLIISFKKTTDAMAVEEYCVKNGINGRLIPLPKEISASCGLAYKCKPSQKDEMVKVLDVLKVDCDKMLEL